MSIAEERIKPYLPRALRSAVDFYNGEVLGKWDDRGRLGRYEDGDDRISAWIDGRKQYVTGFAAAMHITRQAFTDDILPSLDRALDGVYKFNVRKGTVRLKGCGLGPFLDLRAHDDYDDAMEAGIRTLTDQTIRLIAADAAKRLGPCVIERTGGSATIITTTQGTACMNPENTNRCGSVQVVVDTPRRQETIRIRPGGVLPPYAVRYLNH